MSPRRNRSKRARRAPEDDAEESFNTDLPVAAPAGWEVRRIQPHRAVKEYRCPGCQQEVRPGTGHVVAWRTDEPDLRRHWHTPCWQRRGARA